MSDDTTTSIGTDEEPSNDTSGKSDSAPRRRRLDLITETIVTKIVRADEEPYADVIDRGDEYEQFALRIAELDRRNGGRCTVEAIGDMLRVVIENDRAIISITGPHEQRDYRVQENGRELRRVGLAPWEPWEVVR